VNARLELLAAAGVSVWVDDLSRADLVTGLLARRIQAQSVTGVTTNPTIFARAISDGRGYDDALEELRRQRVAPAEAVRLLTAQDVRAAADLLRPVHQLSDGHDGWVSIEVDPDLASDPDGTVAAARLLHWLVGRPNVFVKIPATEASLPAVTRCLAEGISVNVTLIFSQLRYEQVMAAALLGMEQAVAAGCDISRLGCVASFFVSRLDTVVDRQLARLDDPAVSALAGTAGIASAQLVYQAYLEQARSSRWRAVVGRGGAVPRPLWASTGTKDARHRDTRYVEGLISPGAVTTMPPATLEAFSDHGRVGATVGAAAFGTAGSTLDALAAVGVDLSGIAGQLEDEGVAAFAASWHRLQSVVSSRLTSSAA
jgi:transaldolase